MDAKDHAAVVQLCAELAARVTGDDESTALVCRLLQRVAAIPTVKTAKTEVDLLAESLGATLSLSATSVPSAAASQDASVVADALREDGGAGSASVMDLIDTFDKPCIDRGVAGCFRICIAAASKSGKTWLVVELIHLLKKLKRVTEVVVFSSTAELSGDFDKVVPREYQKPFNETRLWNIIRVAQQAKKLGRYCHVLVVFDDGLGDSGLEKSKALQYLFTMGRHANLSAVVISQAPNRLLTPVIKASASHIMFGRLNPDAYKVLGRSMFHGLKQKEFEDWVAANVAGPYVFGVCQQGVGGLLRLRASAQLPKVVLPPPESVEAVAAKLSAVSAPRAADQDSEDDL